MNIGIVNNDSGKSQSLAKKLRIKLKENNINIDQSQPDIIISIGGDGTLLSSFHRYAHLLDRVRFIGIHTGHLGFYTDWREYELDGLVDSILDDNRESVSYPLLDIKLEFHGDREPLNYIALNEGTIKRVNETLVCDVYIKDKHFERFRGDGLCVSTPTGSTGYNKSLGGAVMHPRLEAMQIAEIASINNKVYRSLDSPMILPPDEWIVLKPTRSEDIIISVDQLDVRGKDLESIHFRIAEERIHFARYQHTHFWTRVKDAFIGTSDEDL